MEPATEVALGTLNYFHQLGLDAFKEARSLVHPGSDLAVDVAALNGVTEIDLGKQAWYPLLTACEVAGNVPVLFGPHGTDVRPMPLAVLMRTVLIGAAKSIYVLAPDDSSERQLRLLRVADVDLTDEVRSLTAAASLTGSDQVLLWHV
ncbi:hypothetical protein [Allobranchiibius sp. CTAmp26]|uniref:hypothetical protein n=1 Tax=Allobranchiibius sp. CTAmp26 TaxID=2815214 RepID=UPI001AA1BCC1|nr:hypothetical protein [Allobranchiibius sp. CTAmp26]MBO1756871.1 hypothetical protein [Allobranchiibius sp. CTAmp26]